MLSSFLFALLCLGGSPNTSRLWEIFLRIFKQALIFEILAMRREGLAGRLCSLNQSQWFKSIIKSTYRIFMKFVLFYSRQFLAQILFWSPWDMRLFWTLPCMQGECPVLQVVSGNACFSLIFGFCFCQLERLVTIY